jgi:hypothetical protein
MGTEGMKDALYNRQYGATAGCTVRLLENSIPYGQGNIRHGIRADASKMPWWMHPEGFI